MNLKFIVNKNVLIPRQDTEVLVEETIQIAKEMDSPKILDLCTGSGAIAISLAKHINQANVVGTDISTKALDVAKENNKKLNANVEFIKSDLFNRNKSKI